MSVQNRQLFYSPYPYDWLELSLSIPNILGQKFRDDNFETSLTSDQLCLAFLR